MLSIDKLKSLKVGDILSLSTMQIISDLDSISVDFDIKDIRKYNEPNGALNYTGFLIHTTLDSDLMYMLLVREIGNDFDMLLYYLDTEGDVSQAGEIVLTEDGNDLLERFDTVLFDENDNQQEVTWDKKSSGTFFGIDYTDSEDEGIKTIAGYFTNDDCGDNPHAFLDWSGDSSSGWIEMWLGHEVNSTEIKIYNT